jgi:Isochorismatase family
MDANRTRSRSVSIGAKPGPVTIDLAMTAALVVDMQNDFAAKGGMFERAGIDISVTRAAIGPTARALAAIRQEGIGVIYLKMGFRPDLSDLSPPDSPNRIKHLPMVGPTVTAPDGRESRILVRDTWSTDILDELKPQEGDTVLLQDAVQRVLRNRPPLHPKHAGHQVIGCHWRDDLRMCRLDDSRCDVQRLYVRPAGRLLRRAHWQPIYEKQP